MDIFSLLFVAFFTTLIFFVLLYFVVQAAALEAHKKHTRWFTENRLEIDAKYAPKSIQR